MADTLTTTTQVDPAVSTYYDKVLLVVAEPELLHERFAQRRPLPKNRGNTIKFRRYTKRSTATTPLTEGTTPPGTRNAKTDISATISWYGDYAKVTDVVDMTVEDAVLNEFQKLNAIQLAETRDELMRDILIATASSTNASGGSNGATPTEITKSDIDGIVVTMLGNDAKMMTPTLTASTKVGTSPVRKAFWGISSTAVIDDLEDVSNFRSVAEYPNSAGEQGEWGSTGNVRWCVSSVAHASSDSPVQYYLPIIGQNAYAVTDLNGATETYIHPFGHGEDPIHQRATLGWKMAMVGRILNDNFMHLLKVTHSS